MGKFEARHAQRSHTIVLNGVPKVVFPLFTPASRFGFVEVECKDAGNGKTSATVTYIYTALSENGNRFIDELTAESYREMIDSWQEKVNSYLARVP